VEPAKVVKLPENRVKLIQITNPHSVGVLGPQINKLTKQVNLPTITYESLYTYFTNSVQFGRGVSEFWVACNQENEPLAFAHWMVRGSPHMGLAYLDFIYSWNRMREPVDLLLNEFIQFGQKNNCIYFKGDVINEAVFRVFRKAASKRGFQLNKTSTINFLGRKNG